jgi:hypothetical protein
VVGPATTGANGIATVSSWVIAALFTGPSADNVYNRLVVTASGGGISGNPITFLGTAAVSFASDLVPFWRRSQATGGCINSSCHGNSNPGQNPNYEQATSTLYTFLTTGTRYVSDTTTVTGTVNYLWRKPAKAGITHSPPSAFPTNLVTVIKAWIAQGAPNN